MKVTNAYKGYKDLLEGLNDVEKLLLWREIVKNPPALGLKLFASEDVFEMRCGFSEARRRLSDAADDCLYCALAVLWLQNNDFGAYGALKAIMNLEYGVTCGDRDERSVK